jgi:hypothetical protein
VIETLAGKSVSKGDPAGVKNAAESAVRFYKYFKLQINF